ncbi:ABC transporter ATP-binding protein [Cellulomonas chitinilytica]|uniref:ABC transporter ATP-binding protein n=1 Tax=Cellulomonas chitinilytica TaxID=398759 RepID=A0A919P220_9CELL|nr:ABC transporter ATP-binding protein [Cellulomonas chitinilytica]GIG20236.1 ABC transporter ATP-binding protein [Cellulomonas chitinilytica]
MVGAHDQDGGTLAVRVRGLRKEFGDVVAVDGVDLDVRDGEFLTLLGPSGSGKTTVLRMIAGFELPTAGTVELGGVDVTRRAPFERDVNTVFQDYALFPHMSVLDNVAYGLRVRRVGRRERTQRALEALGSVQLGGFGARRPSQLSGGQRQRVALARALVNRPRVLLLDEPLGALDLKLREQMQVELKAIQRQVGITFVFVTHDQEEALTMSDRIAVFAGGRIEQVGTPADVYERPATPFVAGFVGTSNLLAGEAARQVVGRDGTWSVRPEKIRVEREDDGTGAAPDDRHGTRGTVREVVYVGSATRFVVDLDVGGTLVALQQNLQTSSMDVQGLRGARVRLTWRPEHEFRVADEASDPAVPVPDPVP